MSKPVASIREYFEVEGFEVPFLEEEYKNAFSKITYLCPAGHKGKIPWNSFNTGNRCYKCSGKMKRTQEEASTLLDQAGLTLVSYVRGCNQSLKVVCSLGHLSTVDLSRRSRRALSCSVCDGRVRFDLLSSFASAFPELLYLWDYAGNTVKPTGAPPAGRALFMWSCQNNPQHKWVGSTHSTARGRRCPYCAGKRVLEPESLKCLYPKLMREWCSSNTIKPDEVSPGSHAIVKWSCQAGHKWRASIKNRALNGTGCPQCSGGAVSKISQAWLDSLGIPEEFREYSIRLPGKKRPVKVDGYDPATNTVYEFLGDYWHGNPDLYDSKEVNAHSKKTFGVLYNQTIRRLAVLRKAGYCVVFIWEKDFKER